MAAVTMFSAQPYDRTSFDRADDVDSFDVTYLENRLSVETVHLAHGADAVCVFVNDIVDEPVLSGLGEQGVRCVALRCAGFNNVDLEAAARHDIAVVRVPEYSPNTVAEHTLALILALNRNIHRAYNRVRDRNFALDGLVGFDLAGKTVAVVGAGRIGQIVARLLWHLRCTVLVVDRVRDDHLVELGVEYVELADALASADIVTLNCPLNADTHHLIDAETIAMMKRGAMLVNTGRGGLVDTAAVVDGLKTGHIGSLALDVYEEEGDLFFADRSDDVITDDTFARLLTFPNVLITAHQAFLTHEALAAIASTTLTNIGDVIEGRSSANQLSA